MQHATSSFSLNPGKLAGQCGKLKCCLNFELDQYVEAVKEFPSPNAKIRTPKGKAVVFKMDIFKRLVYFLQLGEPGASPIAMNVEDANELIAASAKGDVVGSLAVIRTGGRTRRSGFKLRQRGGPGKPDAF